MRQRDKERGTERERQSNRDRDMGKRGKTEGQRGKDRGTETER